MARAPAGSALGCATVLVPRFCAVSAISHGRAGAISRDFFHRGRVHDATDAGVSEFGTVPTQELVSIGASGIRHQRTLASPVELFRGAVCDGPGMA